MKMNIEILIQSGGKILNSPLKKVHQGKRFRMLIFKAVNFFELERLAQHNLSIVIAVIILHLRTISANS